MLSASGTKKNSSDEDSSGSEAKVCPEPVTDRFGFLLTNGASAQGLGPHPHLVREREGKWINIINQWEAILMKKSNKVKVQCQKGIPSSLRAKCWPLLCGATERMKPAKHVYKSVDSGAALQHWVDVIERDLDRQFPFHEMFQSKDGHGQHGLFRVLKAYTQFQPDEGYCQAQGPVAAVLLMNMPEEEAFWCLVQISEQYLPGYYSPLLEGVLFDAALLTWLIKRTCPPAYKHLQRHGVEPLMFATDWLMCLFTRHLPFNTLLRVWDLFFCYGVRVLLQVAVVLVRHVLGQAEQRKQCQGQMETLERLRAVKEEVKVEEDTFIAEVCSVPLSTSDLEKQTVKELEKWQKDRPSSTFDPRGRCQGYRMAWAHIIDHKEEQDRKKRETGNLSVTLIRSASTLSLSPSILERWRGGKGSAKEGESRRKIIRHFSMGAKDEWGTWRNLTFKKVQSVLEEDVVVDEHQEQKEKKHQSVPVKNRAEYKYQRGKSQEVEPQLIVNVAHKTSDDNTSEPATGDVQEGSEKQEAGSEPTTHETEEQMIEQLELKAEREITPEEGEEPRRGNEDKTETDLTVEIEGRSSETGATGAQLHNRDSVEIESHPQTDLQAETQEKVGENAAVQAEPALGTVSRPERAEEHDVVIKAGEVINGSEIHQRECDEEIITPGHQEMNEDDADRAESVSPELLEIHMEQTEDPSEPDDQRRDIQTTKAEEDDGKDSRRSSSGGSAGDVCVQKSFTCAAPEEARRLDEELIKPQGKQSGQSVEITGSNPARTPPDTSSVKHKEAARTSSPQVLSNKSVFHRLKGEKAKRKQKLIIPKITVQDFSDPHVQQDDEKLSSRERRRKKNKESETKRKEEKKARKKETRKQKKKSSQLQKEDESKEAVPLGKTGSQSLKHSASYAELYF